MKEQQIVLENIDSFEPKDIFDCGQCFRWNRQKDGSYTGVVRENVLNVKKEKEKVIIQGIGKEKIQEIVTQYFDLTRDYTKIKPGTYGYMYSFYRYLFRMGRSLPNKERDCHRHRKETPRRHHTQLWSAYPA